MLSPNPAAKRHLLVNLHILNNRENLWAFGLHGNKLDSPSMNTKSTESNFFLVSLFPIRSYSYKRLPICRNWRFVQELINIRQIAHNKTDVTCECIFMLFECFLDSIDKVLELFSTFRAWAEPIHDQNLHNFIPIILY